MSAPLIPVDSLLAPLKLAANDEARSPANKIFVINRESANARADRQQYGTVGVLAHDQKGVAKENTPNTQHRLVHKAFDDIWTVPVKKEGKEDGGAKYKAHVNTKKGPGVVFVASIPLADFVEAFPTYFGPAANPDNDGKSVNLYLASQFDDVVKALRVSHFIPKGVKYDAAANAFVRDHSFSLSNVARVIDGVDNPSFNAEKRREFDELVAASVDKAAKVAEAKSIPVGIDPNVYQGAIEVAKNINGAYRKSDRVDVLDVNGSVVCLVGEEPTKNIRNVIADVLDNIPLANLDETFAKKVMKVSGLLPVGSGGHTLAARPTEPTTQATKSKHFPLNLSVVFHDKDGKDHLLPIDFFRSDNARAAGLLVGELKAAKRDGKLVYTVDHSAADSAVNMIAKKESEAETKTVKPKAQPKVAKNRFATKTK